MNYTYTHAPGWVCVWVWNREHLKGYRIHLTMYECVVVRIDLFLSLCSKSSGETLALTALSTITCSYSHTQDLNPLIHTVSLTHWNNNLGSYPRKTKHCFSTWGLYLFSSPFALVLSCFQRHLLTSILCTNYNTYICLWFQFPLLTCKQERRVCGAQKSSLSQMKDATLNYIFVLLGMRVLQMLALNLEGQSKQ